jgi:hypothetical protein
MFSGRLLFVAGHSKARTALSRSHTGIAGLKSTGGMCLYSPVFCVCVLCRDMLH